MFGGQTNRLILMSGFYDFTLVMHYATLVLHMSDIYTIVNLSMFCKRRECRHGRRSKQAGALLSVIF